MPKKSNNSRRETYDRLIRAGKTTEKEIMNMKIKELKAITNDPHILNLIYLQECIEKHNTFGYFNEKKKKKREEET